MDTKLKLSGILLMFVFAFAGMPARASVITQTQAHILNAICQTDSDEEIVTCLVTYINYNNLLPTIETGTAIIDADSVDANGTPMPGSTMQMNTANGGDTVVWGT